MHRCKNVQINVHVNHVLYAWVNKICHVYTCILTHQHMLYSVHTNICYTVLYTQTTNMHTCTYTVVLVLCFRGNAVVVYLQIENWAVGGNSLKDALWLNGSNQVVERGDHTADSTPFLSSLLQYVWNHPSVKQSPSATLAGEAYSCSQEDICHEVRRGQPGGNNVADFAIIKNGHREQDCIRLHWAQLISNHTSY